MTATVNTNFWRAKRVLLTGHTGFKGAWAAKCLQRLGAEVSGISLEPEDKPALFDLLVPWEGLDSRILDIRDGAALKAAVHEIKPQIVIHMAAQALVRRSYREPVDTVATNVLGTVNVLEALRDLDGVEAALVITSDKVYRNDDQGRPFAEPDPLGGDDPYSASKAATEIVTWSWARSFFDAQAVPVATARAGNVLGGGDFSQDRIVPDIWRAVEGGQDLVLRYPQATRPWQHVLDLTAGYLAYVEALVGAKDAPKSLNFGPDPAESMTVGTIAETMLATLGAPGRMKTEPSDLKEKTALAIDAGHAHETIGWSPQLTMPDTLAWTAEWYKRYSDGEAPNAITTEQIERFFKL